jgi:hypothetical protein
VEARPPARRERPAADDRVRGHSGGAGLADRPAGRIRLAVRQDHPARRRRADRGRGDRDRGEAGGAPTGAAPDAPITVVVTDASGAWSALAIVAGSYNVTASAVGFLPASTSSLGVAPGEHKDRVDLALASGGTTVRARSR